VEIGGQTAATTQRFHRALNTPGEVSPTIAQSVRSLPLAACQKISRLPGPLRLFNRTCEVNASMIAFPASNDSPQPPDGYGQALNEPPDGYGSWAEYMEEMSELAIEEAKKSREAD